MSETLEERIKRHEGLALHPHPDAKGFWAIGYGHDITEQEASNYPDGCTLEDAENWLAADIQKAIHGINSALPWVAYLSELRQQVLFEMAFEMGVDGVLAFQHMLPACKLGYYELAGNQMIASVWHTEAKARCEELAQIMITDQEVV
jgi:lysozyme